MSDAEPQKVNCYKALREYFQSQPEGVTELDLTFEQLEELLGGTLPPSARTHASWWANSPQKPDSPWIRAHWKYEASESDLANEKLKFKRGWITESRSKVYHDPIEGGETFEKAAAGITWAWRHHGDVKLAGSRLTFPKPPFEKYWGLYRLRFPNDLVYVGHAFHFKWRWVHYINGSKPGQLVHTAALAALPGSQVAVDLCQEAKVGELALELEKEGTRLMLESIALWDEAVVCGNRLLNAGNLFMKD